MQKRGRVRSPLSAHASRLLTALPGQVDSLLSLSMYTRFAQCVLSFWCLRASEKYFSEALIQTFPHTCCGPVLSLLYMFSVSKCLAIARFFFPPRFVPFKLFVIVSCFCFVVINCSPIFSSSCVKGQKHLPWK